MASGYGTGVAYSPTGSPGSPGAQSSEEPLRPPSRTVETLRQAQQQNLEHREAAGPIVTPPSPTPVRLPARSAVANVTTVVGADDSTIIQHLDGATAKAAPVHHVHAHVQSKNRQRAYLIAAYTADLDATDAEQWWFIPDASEPAQRNLKLGHTHVQRMNKDYDATSKVSAKSGTSPQTDATVWLEIYGVGGASSGKHRLAYDVPEMKANLFAPGHVDEFTITCPDLGALESVRVWHDNDGADWNSSRWKLSKLVVTCIQHSQGTEREVAISESAALCRSTVATAVHSQPAMGDHRSTTGVTQDNMQWHFVPERCWIGCTPKNTAELDRMIADLYDRLHKLEAERDGIRPDCPHLEQLITLRKPAPAPPTVKLEACAGLCPSSKKSWWTWVLMAGLLLLLLIIVIAVVASDGDDTHDGTLPTCSATTCTCP